VKLVVRAFDREHALELIKHDADAFIDEVRKRDAERFALETAGGLFAGRALVLGNIERIDPPDHEARDTQ